MSTSLIPFPGRSTKLGRAIVHLLPAMAGLTFFSLPASAASLGPIRVTSALGERFDATISITHSPEETLSPACVQLVPPGDESEMRVLRRARLDYRKTPRGGEIRILGDEQEQEPLLRLAVRLRCPEEDVRGLTREYNILLDPRDFKPEQTQVAVTAPLAAPSLTAEKPADPPSRPARARSVAKPPTPKAVRPAVAGYFSPAVTPQPATSNEFRLQLSTTPLDPQRTGMTVSEDEKNTLRERLLLIEADDQSAQMLQLKDRISRLEKQLLAMQTLAASQAAAIQANNISEQSRKDEPNWLWAALAGLLLVPAGLLIRRTGARKDEKGVEFDSELELAEKTVLASSTTAPTVAVVPTATAAQAETRHENWGADDMDVVAPGTILEEIQLLLAHGLARQATDLLLQEISLRPTALALWMKLFAVYRDSANRSGFESLALRFRNHFVSESLWLQVQAMGCEVDPANPLYVVQPEPSAAEKQDRPPQARQDVTAVEAPVVQVVPQDAAPDASSVLDTTLEFQLPQTGATIKEAHDSPAEPAPPSSWQADKPIFDFEIPSLELPTLDAETPVKPDDFSSSDAVLQQIAREILNGNRQEACRQLEELLYRGTLEQRLLAAKWLDKLLPVK